MNIVLEQQLERAHRALTLAREDGRSSAAKLELLVIAEGAIANALGTLRNDIAEEADRLQQQIWREVDRPPKQ